MNTTYQPLEKNFVNSISPSANLTFKASDAVSLITSTTFIFSLMIALCVGATMFVYIKGGVYRMQASESGIKKSNEEFRRGTLGLLGVLGLFLILYTLNRDLIFGDVNLANLKLERVASAPLIGPGGASATSTPTGPIENTDEAEVRRILGVKTGDGVNKDGCTVEQMQQSAPSCTNLAGLNTGTINMLLKLKAECGCKFTITGGTEPGHAVGGQHRPGGRAVDISISSSGDPFYSFIKSRGSVINNSPPCNIRYGWSGFIFWDENVGCSRGNTGRHWHVQ